MDELKEKLNDWQMMRKLTLDLLESLPEDKLKLSIGKNMGTLGKQFRHIGDVQHCYNEAIKTGKIDFTKYKRDYSIESSKQKLKQFLNDMDKEMLDLIEKNKDKLIDWEFAKIPLIQHITYLIQHEILHQGELIVYIRTLGFEFPESWKETWGL